ncbi:hypothetical protein K435DRAFT_859673 [Dendrothele bispora CBS 962.96]|uniref:Uncharacterized protein n=1 Tax=Dendrothele bispora (strain CBS 962.96) TaxID=1314807 RepID=A0A4S8M108_DENBC|nr:hypothetical protein K435DRAFT_859673 [Dendrothele bispora CBS 962.96]
MGMHQRPLSLEGKKLVKSIRARFYPHQSQNPRWMSAFYRESLLQTRPAQQYVLAADELSGPRQQPYVHDIVVTLTYRRKVYKFRVFFKRHKLLPTNKSIRALCNVDVDGDVLVVACGKEVDVRNMRGKEEGRAADLAVKRLFARLDPLRGRRLPAVLSV